MEQHPSQPDRIPTPPARGSLSGAPAASVLGEGARLSALAALLDDPSPAVWDAVRAGLERAGRAALPWLRRAQNHPDPRARVRARSLEASFQRRGALRRFAATVARGSEADGATPPAQRGGLLEAGLLRLARVLEPTLDAGPLRAELDRLAAAVGARAQGLDTPMARALALVDVLCEEEGFRGAEEAYHHPDNAHLARVLERRRGLPLSLVALHLLVARRAGVRAAAVPLPGHVMLRLYAGERSLLVDPFHGGRIRTRKDCLTYLMQQGLAPRPDWFEDASDRALLLRQAGNLVNGLRQAGRGAEARELAAVLEPLVRRPALAAEA